MDLRTFFVNVTCRPVGHWFTRVLAVDALAGLANGRTCTRWKGVQSWKRLRGGAWIAAYWQYLER